MWPMISWAVTEQPAVGNEDPVVAKKKLTINSKKVIPRVTYLTTHWISYCPGWTFSSAGK